MPNARTYRFVAALICVAAGFFPTNLKADNRVSPRISSVTVYRVGAKLSSVATVKIPAGKSEVIFENLSPHFNPNSLQVKIKGSASLISAIFQVKSPGPGPENPLAPVLRDSLVLLGDEFTRIRDERQVYTQEQSVMERKIDQIGSLTDAPNSTRSLSVAELRDLTNFYRQRLLEIKERLLILAIKERKSNELYQKIQQKLQKLQPNVGNRTGEITLKLDATSAQSVEIVCTYLVSQASWTPQYDLRSEGFNKPLRLIYKANVRNLSGFDWNNIQLQLSSANPLVNNDRPILTPVFVDFRPVYARQQNNFSDVNIYNMTQAPSASADLERAASAKMEEIVFSEPVGASLTQDEFIANFEIAQLQDILADGQDNIVQIDEQDMPAKYEYHAVPKLDPAVFLLAKITDYGRFNLLPGMANIFYQDTYVGQTTVNPHTVSDTLLLSLGRDEQITIKRVQPKDFTERRKIFSNTIKETYTYEIAIKNNKSIPIRTEVLDQIPVSKQKDIVVELEEKDGAAYNEDFGKLKWDLEIPAGQTKRVRFTYTVKFPKDKAVAISRH